MAASAEKRKHKKGFRQQQQAGRGAEKKYSGNYKCRQLARKKNQTTRTRELKMQNEIESAGKCVTGWVLHVNVCAYKR